MFETLRWITIVILWVCIFLNAYGIIMNRRLSKSYQKAYDNCMKLFTSCEKCAYYDAEAANCPKSGMKMLGEHGFCCYVKRKEENHEGENSN